MWLPNDSEEYVFSTGRYGHASVFRCCDLSQVATLFDGVIDASYRVKAFGASRIAIVVALADREAMPGVAETSKTKLWSTQLPPSASHCVIIFNPKFGMRDSRILLLPPSRKRSTFLHALCPVWSTWDPVESPTRILVGGSFADDVKATLFDVDSQDRPVVDFDHVDGFCTACAVPEMRNSVFLGGGPTVSQIDLETLSACASFPSTQVTRSAETKTVAVSFEHQCVVVGYSCRTSGLAVCSLKTGELVTTVGRGSSVWSVYCCDDKSAIIAGLTGGQIAVYDPRNPSLEVSRFQVHQPKRGGVSYWVYEIDRLNEWSFVSASEQCSVAKWKLDGTGIKLVSTPGSNIGVCGYPAFDFSRTIQVEYRERFGFVLSVFDRLAWVLVTCSLDPLRVPRCARFWESPFRRLLEREQLYIRLYFNAGSRKNKSLESLERHIESACGSCEFCDKAIWIHRTIGPPRLTLDWCFAEVSRSYLGSDPTFLDSVLSFVGGLAVGFQNYRLPEREPSQTLNCQFVQSWFDQPYRPLKVTFVGDMSPRIGKTSLILRSSKGVFAGSDQLIVDEQLMSFHFGDFGPFRIFIQNLFSCNENYDGLASLKYELADVFILCFDCFAPNSLRSIQERFFEEAMEVTPTAKCILCALKCDLRDDKAALSVAREKGVVPVTREEAIDVARALDIEFYVETSSKRADVAGLFPAIIVAGLLSRFGSPDQEKAKKCALM